MSVNAPARPHEGTMDVDEFMAFLEMRPKEERWHLIEGIAVMMAAPSLAHQWIAVNFCALLNRAFAAQASNLFAYHEIAIRLPGVPNDPIEMPELGLRCSVIDIYRGTPLGPGRAG